MSEPYDVYFSVDIETDGPIPGRFSMLSFGFAVAGSSSGGIFRRADPSPSTSYRELRRISRTVDPGTLKVSGLDRDVLEASGARPEDAMTDAAEWVRMTAANGQPVLVACRLAYAGLFMTGTSSRSAQPVRPSGTQVRST